MFAEIEIIKNQENELKNMRDNFDFGFFAISISSFEFGLGNPLPPDPFEFPGNPGLAWVVGVAGLLGFSKASNGKCGMKGLRAVVGCSSSSSDGGGAVAIVDSLSFSSFKKIKV